ncbi:MAG: DUF424 family protein [Nitrososphaerota archaeon]
MGKRFWVKVHHSRTGEVVVAACDEELLGKNLKIVEGLSVEVSRTFYGGVLVGEDELQSYLKQGTIINLLGEYVIEYALSHGLIIEKAVTKVGGVPHVQIYC